MNLNAPDPTVKLVGLLRERVRLEKFHRRVLYLVFAVLWGSGGAWLISEWLKDPELGPTRTVLQTLSMEIHGATMLVYVAMLGTLWTHVRRGFALKANRLSGSFVIATNVILALSGWVLYYLTDDGVRRGSSTIHWVIGIAVLPLLIAHILLGRFGFIISEE